jgi:chlorobactene glucosyltransferase
MSVTALVNVVYVRSLSDIRGAESEPLVSILLPARNEERTLDSVLRSLTRQEYPRMEILVLDDGSEDSTAHIAARWAETDPRIRLIHGRPLPAGWVGKSHACSQLAEHARGEYLLFVDADTMHSPQSVRAAMAELRRTGAGLLTVIPRQVMQTFWENALLPLLHFSTFCFLPMPLVGWSKHPSLAMANGQFMLFRRDAYERIGGHAAVRSAMVEDVWLSRLVKAHGYLLAIREGGDVVSARMYRSLKEIWNGFSKNLFAGFNYSLPLIAAVIIFNVCTSILPFVLCVGAFSVGGGAGLLTGQVMLQVGLILMIRVALAYRFQLALWPVLLHPLAMVIFVGIALNSVRWVLFGGGAQWKGRRYDVRNKQVIQE